jgi:hypothetical protein
MLASHVPAPVIEFIGSRIERGCAVIYQAHAGDSIPNGDRSREINGFLVAPALAR